MKRFSLFIFSILVFTSTLLAQQEDATGCKDHPLFNRIPNFYINECEHLLSLLFFLRTHTFHHLTKTFVGFFHLGVIHERGNTGK